MITIKDKNFDLFIFRIELERIVKEVSRHIKRDWRNNYDITGLPILVVVLKGAATFAADLSRELSPYPFEIEYIRLSSYEGTESTGEIKNVAGISRDILGRDVIIVEDIVETGLTVDYLKNYLLDEKEVNSVKICSLFTRPKNYKCNVDVDYVGVELTNDEFIVGYGLDYDEEGRNLNDIYKLST